MKKSKIKKLINVGVRINRFSKNNLYKFIFNGVSDEMLCYLNRYDISFLICFKYRIGDVYKCEDIDSIVQNLVLDEDILIFLQYELYNVNIYKLNQNDFLSI